MSVAVVVAAGVGVSYDHRQFDAAPIENAAPVHSDCCYCYYSVDHRSMN